MTHYLRLVMLLAALLAVAHGGCRSTEKAPDRRVVEQKRAIQVVEQHYPDGSLRMRKEVTQNEEGDVVNHGPYERWFPDGQKEYRVVFVMGGKHGIETRWHKNGMKWSEAVYVNGLRHGTSRTWDDTGRLRSEEQHFEGKPHGTWTTWGSKGQIKWRQTFEHGKPGP